MTPSTIELSAVDLAISAGLVVLAGAISVALHLNLERRLAWASIRTVLQLLLIGQVLRFVFGIDQPSAVVGVVVIMTAAAGRAAVTRPAYTFPGAFGQGFFTLALTGLVTTFAVTGAVVGVEPWYEPRYVIPFCGMVLGNTLTGISLCLDELLGSLHGDWRRVEMELAHGASRWEAARRPVTAAVRRGMIPIINAMSVVGIVSLPGVMTGQILAGADPWVAVKYQIVVMFMVAGGTTLGCITIALLVYRRFFGPEHRLDVEAIRRRADGPT